jgi:hypothetical protein
MLSCPSHDALMLPHTFLDASLPEGTLRCPNLSCSIVYIEGASKGFHTLGPEGDLTPYSGDTA